MIRAMKIKLLPTKEQEKQMLKTINVCRYAWNWGLKYSKDYYAEYTRSLSCRKIRDEFTVFKKLEENKWINEVSSKAYNQEFENLSQAFKMFFKKVSDFPKFKTRKHSKKSFFVRPDNMRLTEDTVNIEKVGRVKYKSDKKIPDTKKYNPYCSFNGRYWILSFGIDVEKQDIKLTDEIIGIDLGIKTLAVCSNRMSFNNINKSKKVKDLESKLKREQRAVSRKYEANKDGNTFIKTNNIIKQEKKIAKTSKKLADIRQNHIHQVTRKIINTLPKKIVLEDLNVKGMMKNRCLSKAIAKCKFYEFRRQIEYKAEEYGIEVLIADRFYPSSKRCNKCGNIKKDLKLSDRLYTCNCGYQEDRDVNSSFNLRDYED